MSRLVSAKLVKLKTDDGMVETSGPQVELGKEYQVDLDSIQEVVLFNTDFNQEHKKLIVQGYSADDHWWEGWLCLEMLEVRADG